MSSETNLLPSEDQKVLDTTTGSTPLPSKVSRAVNRLVGKLWGTIDSCIVDDENGGDGIVAVLGMVQDLSNL